MGLGLTVEWGGLGAIVALAVIALLLAALLAQTRP